MKPTREECEQWNPLIIDLDNIPAESKETPTGKQLEDVRLVLPHHELVFRYDWVPATPNDEIFGCIGQPLNDHFLHALVDLFGLADEGKADSAERKKSMDYWWPAHGDKKMIPLGFFKMPASYDEVCGMTMREPPAGSYGSPYTNYYGCRDMRPRQYFRRGTGLIYTTTFFVFGTMISDWTNPLERYRVMAKQDIKLDGILTPQFPCANEDAPDPALIAERAKEVADALVNQTGYRQWEEAADDPIWVNTPRHTLAAPKLVIEADCLYEGRYKDRYAELAEAELWDYATCGSMTYEQWSKDPRFTTKDSVCQMFGRPASQQEPHRPIVPNRHPSIRAMIPFLNFNDSEHDMTHQLYVDGLSMDYCQDRRATTYMDSSCT